MNARTWRKSSYSSGQGNCVEVSTSDPGVVALGDAVARHVQGEVLSVGRDGASDALSFLKAGLVDRLSAYRAGVLMGADSRSAVGALGLAGLDFAPRFALVSSRIVGDDTLETWRRAS